MQTLSIKDSERRKNLAIFLKKERETRGWSQRDLARYLDATQNAIYMWEAEKATPDTSNYDKLASLFGFTTWELIQMLEPGGQITSSEPLGLDRFLKALDKMPSKDIVKIINAGVQKLAQVS